MGDSLAGRRKHGAMKPKAAMKCDGDMAEKGMMGWKGSMMPEAYEKTASKPKRRKRRGR